MRSGNGVVRGAGTHGILVACPAGDATMFSFNFNKYWEMFGEAQIISLEKKGKWNRVCPIQMLICNEPCHFFHKHPQLALGRCDPCTAAHESWLSVSAYPEACENVACTCKMRVNYSERSRLNDASEEEYGNGGGEFSSGIRHLGTLCRSSASRFACCHRIAGTPILCRTHPGFLNFHRLFCRCETLRKQVLHCHSNF